MIRVDHPDVVYKTEKGKFEAVIDEIVRCHEKGQPVLVGTISIEKSELLSAMLRRRKIEHQVLNAKYHEKEAQIVAQAGQYGAVTIATNMAGRGTDIMLGGNAEFLAKAELVKEGFDDEQIYEITGFSETEDESILEGRKHYRELMDKFEAETKEKALKVKEAGGLFIIGTERHESRRIDNQLRGRSGRQGDEGESRFYLSLEDDLMRLFGGDRITAMMNTLNVDENTPIESKMLSNVIESAQRKVEARNFNIRKNVLNYDDVMNAQREIIYGQRAMVLEDQDIHEKIIKMIRDFVSNSVNAYLCGDEEDKWNFSGLREHFAGLFTIANDFNFTTAELNDIDKQSIIDMTTEAALKRYDEKEAELTPPILREVERVALLQVVDRKWEQHIDDMDELKKGIGLRSYGSHDPVVAYRMEGFEMFDAMVESICEDTIRILYNTHLRKDVPIERKQAVKADPTPTSDGSLSATRKVGKKPGRNDPCPCGSGLKYKKCCGRNA